MSLIVNLHSVGRTRAFCLMLNLANWCCKKRVMDWLLLNLKYVDYPATRRATWHRCVQSTESICPNSKLGCQHLSMLRFLLSLPVLDTDWAVRLAMGWCSDLLYKHPWLSGSAAQCCTLDLTIGIATANKTLTTLAQKQAPSECGTESALEPAHRSNCRLGLCGFESRVQ